MKYLRKNDCIMLVFSVVLFAVLQLLITERILISEPSGGISPAILLRKTGKNSVINSLYSEQR